MTDTREDLKKKLRAKIRQKRNGSDIENLSKKLTSDPVGTFLSMGIDDVDTLNNSKSIVKDPQSFLKSAKDTIEKNSRKEVVDESDEEAPPPL